MYTYIFHFSLSLSLSFTLFLFYVFFFFLHIENIDNDKLVGLTVATRRFEIFNRAKRFWILSTQDKVEKNDTSDSLEKYNALDDWG